MSKGVNITRYVVNGGGFLSEYFLSIIFQDKKMKDILKEKEEDIKRIASEIRREYRRGVSKLGKDSSNMDVKRQVGTRVFKWLGYDSSIFRSHWVIKDEKDRAIGTFYEYSEDGNGLILFYFVGFEEHIESGRNSGYKTIKRALFRTGIKWGIVTNGRVFRLVKNEALGNAYLDIDLYRALEDGYFDVFKLFVLLFSKDSIVSKDKKSILEIIEERCKEEAASVGTELRDTVYQAVEKMVREIHARNPDVDLKELFEETLIYMFRLLFMFYAESVELLPVDNEIYRAGYSITNLRELILDDEVRFSEEKYFVWETLNAAFKIINQGVKNSFISVKPYNGGLFDSSKTPIISSIKLPDSVMIEIIKDISLTPPKKGRTRDRVSFRELGISQLGSIYESLLELEPKVAEEDLTIVDGRFVPFSKVQSGEIKKKKKSKKKGETIKVEIRKGDAYLSFWGGTRKSTGTYYTPRQITEFLVKSALEGLVEGKSSDDILKIKVVDPAMGSAAFLVAAVNFLGDAYYEAMLRKNEEMKDKLSEEEIEELRKEEKWFLDEDVEIAKRISRRRVLENCIYGVDINPLAVDLAKVSLWLTAMEKNRPLTFLDHKLRCGNSLIGTTAEKVKEYPEEVVNLPHLKERAKRDPELKKRLNNIKKEAKISSKTRMFFTEEGEDMDMLVNSLVQDVKELTNYRRRLMTPEESVDDIKLKEKIWHDFEGGENKEGREFLKLRKVYDLWTALWFWEWYDLPTPREYAAIVGKIIKDRELSEREKEIMKKVEQLRDKYRFFHWELEFPEVFSEGGFSAAVGNPPWDKVQTEKDDFFGNYIPNIKKLSTTEKDSIIESLLKEDKALRKKWMEYSMKKGIEANFYRNGGLYPVTEGNLDMYRLFLERFLFIIRDNGILSIVLEGFHNDKRSTSLRKFLFDNTVVKYVIIIQNWHKLFDITTDQKINLLSVKKSKPTRENEFTVGFLLKKDREVSPGINLDPKIILENGYAPTADELENVLPYILNNGPKMSKNFIKRFSPDAFTITEFLNMKEYYILDKIYDNHPLLMDNDLKYHWHIKFLSEELNKTRGKKFSKKYGDLKILKGDHLGQLYICTSCSNEYALLNEINEFLLSKECSRAKKDGKNIKINCRKNKDLQLFKKYVKYHYQWYRIGIRLVASANHERTILAAILPQNIVVYNSIVTSIPYRYITENNRIHQKMLMDYYELFFFVSSLTSLVLEFVVRRKVSRNLNLFYLYQLPLPRLTSGNWFFEQIVPRAARLICVDEEFAELWEETFKPEWREIGKTSRVGGWENLEKKWRPEFGVDDWVMVNSEKRDGTQRAQLRAEIDALVAYLYGLTRDEFSYILDTFPVLKRKEINAFGEYRTKRMCLEEYDRIGNIIDKEKIFKPEMFNINRYKNKEE